MIQSQLLLNISKIKHGFGTIKEPIPHFLKNVWDKNKHKISQSHEAHIKEITIKNQEIKNIDGYFCKTSNLPIGVITADCVPILISHKDATAIAALHSGWKGTLKNITAHCWNHLKVFDPNPKNWIVAIGPSIQNCCYQVGEEVSKLFIKKYHQYDVNLITPFQQHLNLSGIIHQQCKEIGFINVDILTVCTQCSVLADKSHLLYSYRRNKTSLRQLSMIIKN